MDLTFGQKIKEARKIKGLTQKQLATKIGAKHNSVSDWENNKNKPDPDTIEFLCGVLEITPNYLLTAESDDFSSTEKSIIKKYRDLDEYGKESLRMMLERESERTRTLKAHAEQLTAKDTRIAELEAAAQSSAAKQIVSLIDFQTHTDRVSHMVEYFRSTSAGDGIFIMGNEDTEQVMIPNVPPEAREADYAIKISGISMEPDYHNGEVALVSHTAEMHFGDVGIFIINGNAYIKEYRKDELVSKNPESPNITIAEYDNIVCMGKVIGKIREEDMVKV